MSITVIVAVEERVEGDKPRSEEIVLQGNVLTAKNAELARTLAFGSDASVIVAHGWGDAFYVPGRNETHGHVQRRWSAERTRRLFANSKEETVTLKSIEEHNAGIREMIESLEVIRRRRITCFSVPIACPDCGQPIQPSNAFFGGGPASPLQRSAECPHCEWRGSILA